MEARERGGEASRACPGTAIGRDPHRPRPHAGEPRLGAPRHDARRPGVVRDPGDELHPRRRRLLLADDELDPHRGGLGLLGGELLRAGQIARILPGRAADQERDDRRGAAAHARGDRAHALGDGLRRGARLGQALPDG